MRTTSPRIWKRSTSGVLRFPSRDVVLAWLAATVLSGIPSTLYAFATGGDLLEATRAAGAMLLPKETSTVRLFAAAAVVHPLVSAFWALVLAVTLPKRHVLLASVLASVAIALLDLLVIAPAFFRAVAALEFWPQLADHVAWGVCFGGVLALRGRGRS